MAPGGKAVRERVIGFHVERALEKRQRLRGPVRHRRIDVWDGSERAVIRVEIVGPLSLDALDFRLA